ncbi:MAG: NUDIX family dNTPase [Parcubacteria bacterium C7867-008]|nr:MAG: NUDIX family dNTPase [Parcubacteria bacterium C7867-008]
MTEKQKVVVYVVKDGKLLVFRHTDFSYEEVGIQVPAGTIKEGEDPESAALRELHEETGRDGFRIVEKLGVETYHKMPEKPETHVRHFFLAESITSHPERWLSQELHDGEQEPTNFECFWIPLDRGHILESGLGALLHKVV